MAFFWLITNSALVEVECELRKDFSFLMLLIPFGKIKEGKERVLWFFLNTPWYLGPTAGIRWVLLADEDERTDVPQECVSQCRQSLLEDKITGNGSHFYKRKKRKTKCWFVIFFFLVVLEFPFLDEFLTSVNLWKANYDFQCFSLKLSTQFSILHPSSDSILLEMLYAILYLHKEWIANGRVEIWGVWITSISYIASCIYS